MENKTYSIGEVSEKTGVTIRTLHYYDEIGLIKPKKHPKSGHRIYTEKDILTLHKILSLKFIGLSLDDIREIIQKPTIDVSVKEILKFEREILYQKKLQIEKSLNAIDHTLDLLAEEKEIESDILMSLLRNIQTEEEQKEWMKKYYDQQVIDTILDKFKDEERMKAFEKLYIEFVKQIKQLYGRPVDDEAVQTAIDKYLKLSLKYLGIEQMEQLQILQPNTDFENINIEEFERLTPSPFTKEVEQWLEEAMEVYMIRNEIQMGENS